MMIIGLTGPSGAGKGTVAACFARRGIPCVDTDAVYRRLLVPPSRCLSELAERFGPGIISPDGALNRPALADIVFAPGHRAERDDLNRIAHRHILREVRAICRKLEAAGCPAVLVEAPLIFESGFDRECDRILCVTADRRTRLSRVMERDGLDAAAAEARLNAQQPDGFYLSRSDAVIENNGTPADVEEAVLPLLRAWEVPGL